MQTESENNQSLPEAPQAEQTTALTPEPTPAGETPESADTAASSDAIASTDPAATSDIAVDTTTEQSDGLLQESPEDLTTDPSAVDPKIDVGLLEAYLFSTHSPLTAGRLAELFNLESTKPIRKALRLLNEQYEQTRRCFRVEQVAGGFQLLTLPDYHEGLKALIQKEQDSKLTKAALETLAIIAYKQPILRAEVESIRGVASGETIRSLMEKHLVKIAGRAEEPGRPILYGTTKRFLEIFGLNSLKDLPQPEALQARAQQMAAAQRLAEQPDEGHEQPAEMAADNSPAEPTPEPEAAAIPGEPTPADEQPSEQTDAVADQPSTGADMDEADEGTDDQASAEQSVGDDGPADSQSPKTAPEDESESTDDET